MNEIKNYKLKFWLLFSLLCLIDVIIEISVHKYLYNSSYYVIIQIMSEFIYIFMLLSFMVYINRKIIKFIYAGVKYKNINLDIISVLNKYKLLFKNLDSGFAIHEIILDKNNNPCDYRYLEINHVFEKIMNIDGSEIIGKTAKQILSDDEFDMSLIQKFSNIALNGSSTFLEIYIPRLKKYYHITVYSTEYKKFITIYTDITKQKENEIKLQCNDNKSKILIDLLQFSFNTISEFLDYALNQAILLTDSKIGYIYYYNEDEKKFILNSWSKTVMDDCKISNPLTEYELEKTGIWGEVVRQRKSIIINNYKDENLFKKGYPEGHVILNNFISIPIFRNDKIEGVIGLANRNYDYTERDILEISILLESIWKIVEREKYFGLLKTSELKYKELYDDIVKNSNELKESKNYIECLFNITNSIQNISEFDKLIKSIIAHIELMDVNVICEFNINNIIYKDINKDINSLYELKFIDILKDEFNSSNKNIINIYSKKDIEISDSEIRLFKDISNRISKVIYRKKMDDFKIEHENKIFLSNRMELIGLLSSNIIHSFNNILQTLVLNLSMMQQDERIQMLASDYLNNIDNCYMSMQSIIHQLLITSKGKLELFPSYIDLFKLISNQVSLFKSSRPDVQMEIIDKTNLKSKGLCVYIDVNQFSQIFLNLFINSYHALSIQDNKIINITISFVKEDFSLINNFIFTDYIKISVTDNGVGISDDIQSKIFDPFFTTKKDGSGLGLSTVYTIIKKHNGLIDVNSEKDKYTTFNIYLPRLNEPDNINGNNKNIDNNKKNSDKNILLIDDDSAVLSVLKKLLYDYTIIDFSNPLKAITEYNLNHENIDLIITDFRMNEMTGIELIENCKFINPQCKCVLISGYINNKIEEIVKNYNDVKFLLKPLDRTVLLSTIETLIGK